MQSTLMPRSFRKWPKLDRKTINLNVAISLKDTVHCNRITVFKIN